MGRGHGPLVPPPWLRPCLIYSEVRKISWTPSLRCKLQNCRTELIVSSFESSWRDKDTLKCRNCLFLMLSKLFTKTKWLPRPFCFSSIFFKMFKFSIIIVTKLFFLSIAFEWAYGDLCTTILIFRPYYRGSLRGGDQNLKESRHIW